MDWALTSCLFDSAFGHIRSNQLELLQRRLQVFHNLQRNHAGAGRLSLSASDSSLSQKMSRLVLSRAASSS